MSRFNTTSRGDHIDDPLAKGLCAVVAIGLGVFVSAAAAPTGADAVDPQRSPESRPVLSQADGANAPTPGSDIDEYVKRLIEQIKDNRQKHLTGVETAPPIKVSRARFDLLPNWDMDRSAARLLPNFEPGSAQFLWIELYERGTDPAPKTITLDPPTIAPAVTRP